MGTDNTIHCLHFLSYFMKISFFHLLIFSFITVHAQTPSSSSSIKSKVEEKAICKQCIPHYHNLSDSTQCQLNQRWGSEDNFLCGPNSGLGCELDKYDNASIPLNVRFENINATVIKPECALTYYIPTPTATTNEEAIGSLIMSYGTGRNCTGNFDIYLRVESPCYQHKLFQYGFESHR
jgi:hypothetical protein